jgi:hypothetical protein
MEYWNLILHYNAQAKIKVELDNCQNLMNKVSSMMKTKK